jgi:hypothetical protein
MHKLHKLNYSVDKRGRPASARRSSPPPASSTGRALSVLTTESLPRGYPGQLFRFQRVLELDGEREDSRFISVRAPIVIE